MISKETYDKLQEYKEIGLSILKSSEKLNLSYKTAYTWWNKTDEEFTSFQKQHEFMLDNYRQYLIEQIKICPQINNSLLLKRLMSEFSDFSVPPATFYRYIKKLREQTGYLKPKRKEVLRDEVNPGYEGQVDFGQYTMKTMYKTQKTLRTKILRSDLIVIDELFYLTPSAENLVYLYKTIMFLSETRSFIFVTNRPLSEWDNMDVDTHIVSTFRSRIMTNAQLIHLG